MTRASVKAGDTCWFVSHTWIDENGASIRRWRLLDRPSAKQLAHLGEHGGSAVSFWPAVCVATDDTGTYWEPTDKVTYWEGNG